MPAAHREALLAKIHPRRERGGKGRRVVSQVAHERAVRAVGLANGRNPISIIVPCHRVIGANGTLTGYGGGLERKRFLLELESGGCPRL